MIYNELKFPLPLGEGLRVRVTATIADNVILFFAETKFSQGYPQNLQKSQNLHYLPKNLWNFIKIFRIFLQFFEMFSVSGNIVKTRHGVSPAAAGDSSGGCFLAGYSGGE